MSARRITAAVCTSVALTFASASAALAYGTDSGPNSLQTEDPCAMQGAILGDRNGVTNDVLKGTSGDDIICGFGGDDTIEGLGGNDRIYGGDGADTIYGPGSSSKSNRGDHLLP
jgi:Ca2+-binding RTX toxin-like protein